MALSIMLLAGSLGSWADESPAIGTKVGATVEGGIVVYEVTGAYDAGKKGIPVKITGLDYDGLKALGTANGSIDLTVKTAFIEKYGTTQNHYFVEEIIDGWDGLGEAKYAFYGYPQLKTLTFVNDNSAVPTNNYTFTVGKYSFYGCTYLESLVLPDNVSKIDTRAFQNTKITNFVIPAKCASIGEYAFYNCQKLATVSVSSAKNSVMTTIGTHVFGNSTLHELDLTNATAFTTFNGQPFMYESSVVNNQLQTVKLPASFTTLNGAFKDCTGLTSINLENTKCAAVNDTHTFQGCSALPALIIPGTATVSQSPFDGCVKLASLTFKPAGSPATISKPVGDGINNLYGGTDASLAALKTLVFDGTLVSTIDDEAFAGCTGLTTVTFNNLQGATINGAFQDCTALTTLTIAGITSPSNAAALTAFNPDAFRNTGLTALTIPTINNKAQVTFADDSFIENANLASVEFKDITTDNTVTFNKAFQKNPALASVKFNAINKGTLNINTGAFSDNDALALVEFGTIGSSNGETMTIDDGAFTNNPALAEVKFAGVDGAYDKTSLTIGAGALVFGDATAPALAKVTFGNIKALNFDVKAGAFASKALKEVTFGNLNVATFAIGANAFLGDTDNPKYEKVAFGNIGGFSDAGFAGPAAYAIGANAFDAGVNGAKAVTFGTISDATSAKVTTLGIANQAFRGAASVVFDVIKANNVTINDYAFKGDKLATVEFKGIQNVTNATTSVDIKQYAFEAVEIGSLVKTVKFGAIAQNGINNNINLTIENDAFRYGTKSVEFASIKANKIDIQAGAFKSDKLETVTFGDITAKDFDIAANAFSENLVGKGEGYTSVKFGNLTNWVDGAANAAATYDIAKSAFIGGNKTIEFGTIKDASANTTSFVIADGTGVADGAFSGVKSVTFGDLQASTVTIGQWAFYGANIEAVTFGTIKNPNAKTSNVTIDQNAFISDAATEKTKVVTFGAINQPKSPTTNVLNLTINDNAFRYGVKTVTFSDIQANTVTIEDNAFQSDKLETVTFGKVYVNTFAIDANAFKGGDAYASVTFGDIHPVNNNGAFGVNVNAFDGGNKVVKIGNIARKAETNSLKNFNVNIGNNAFIGTQTVEIGNVESSSFIVGINAFAGDELTSVKLGNISSADYNIGVSAFQGGKLATVKIGNLAGGATDATIDTDAFKCNNNTDVIEESITIGNLNSTGLDIAAGAFEAAQADGSKLTLKIGNIAATPAGIAAGAFKAAPTGTAIISLGNIAAPVNATVAATAFEGSQVDATDPLSENATSLTLKDIDNAFADNTFTNVYSVTMDNVNVLVDVNAFADAAEVTVNGDIAFGGLNTAMFQGTGLNAMEVKSLTFNGSVGKNATDGAAGTIGKFDSPLIRKIVFPTAIYTGSVAAAGNVEVHTGAVAAGAFNAAYLDAQGAAPQQNILVKYYCEELQSRAGHQIFNVDAFTNVVGDDKLVVLYTNEWAKANIFESGAPVNGIDYSLSEVTPGTEVAASVVKSKTNSYYYGKLYLPAGSGQYKIAREPAAGVTINIYEGRIDEENIYMKQLDLIENTYWIDADDMDQVFVVRSTSDAEVKAEPVTEEDDAITTDVDFYYYDKSDGKKNSLKYSFAGVVNTELQNSEPYRSKNIYVMANPASSGFAFAKLDQFATSRNLAAKSLYVLGKKSAASRLNVIWEDEIDNTEVTGIETIATEAENSAVYNLQGVRVNNVKKGTLYIKNGKKLVK